MRYCAAGPWPHSGGALTTLLLTGRSRRRFTAVSGRGPRRQPPACAAVPPSPAGLVFPPGGAAPSLRCPQAAARCAPLSPTPCPPSVRGPSCPSISPPRGSSGYPARRRTPRRRRRDGGLPALRLSPCGEERRSPLLPARCLGGSAPTPAGPRAEGARLW